MTKKQSALHSFIEFIREQGVVGLAAAVVLGAAAKDVVDSLVQDVINPLIGVIFDAEQLAGQTLTMGRGESAVEIGWGNLLSRIISFVVVAAVVYFVLNRFMAKLDKKKA